MESRRLSIVMRETDLLTKGNMILFTFSTPVADSMRSTLVNVLNRVLPRSESTEEPYTLITIWTEVAELTI